VSEPTELFDAREYGPIPQYPIESVDNALRVLMLFVERSEVRLTEVSSHLGVASSTAHRLLAMLAYRGLVRQDLQTKAYRSGPSLDLLAFSVVGRLHTRVRARPVLEKLNADLRETVHLGRLDATYVDFVDSIESPQALRVSARLGVAMPAHCTSTGKALLAALTDKQLEALYCDPDLAQLTPQSIKSRKALKSELAAVRRRGFATSDEEGEEGVVSMAVPLRGSSFALAVSVPVSRMDDDFRATVLENLLAAKAEIDALLP
jgi:IclR family acetate operon transcriptional repressor